MRWLVLMALLWIGCGFVQDLESRGPRLREPEWSDTDFVLDSIACALERKLGAASEETIMRFELREAEPDYPLREYVDTGRVPPMIILRGDQPSAIRTPLRHAVFAHLVPRFLEGDWNQMHSARWRPIEDELNRIAGACRLEAQR